MDSQPSKETRWFFENVHVHESSLKAYLRKAFPWLADPDNLVQDAMAKLWRAGQGQKIRHGKAFLFATARHAALDSRRREHLVAIDSIGDMQNLSVLDEGPGVSETVSRHEELALLADAIRALPVRCRQVLTLRKIYGVSQKDIAAQLGISENTVEVHIANGMRKCAEYMIERCTQ